MKNTPAPKKKNRMYAHFYSWEEKDKTLEAQQVVFFPSPSTDLPQGISHSRLKSKTRNYSKEKQCISPKPRASTHLSEQLPAGDKAIDDWQFTQRLPVVSTPEQLIDPKSINPKSDCFWQQSNKWAKFQTDNSEQKYTWGSVVCGLSNLEHLGQF